MLGAWCPAVVFAAAARRRTFHGPRGVVKGTSSGQQPATAKNSTWALNFRCGRRRRCAEGNGARLRGWRGWLRLRQAREVGAPVRSHSDRVELVPTHVAEPTGNAPPRAWMIRAERFGPGRNSPKQTRQNVRCCRGALVSLVQRRQRGERRAQPATSTNAEAPASLRPPSPRSSCRQTHLENKGERRSVGNPGRRTRSPGLSSESVKWQGDRPSPTRCPRRNAAHGRVERAGAAGSGAPHAGTAGGKIAWDTRAERMHVLAHARRRRPVVSH